MSVMDDFKSWKEFLNDRVEQAESLGMERDSIDKVAYRIGDYLAKSVDPKNPQERVLQDLWEVGDEDEQRTIASLMVKLAKRDG